MSPQVTDSATCEHAVIVTLRYLDDDDTEYAGKVAMWACADCRLRFSPGRSDVPLPDPALLGIAGAEAAGSEGLRAGALVLLRNWRDASLNEDLSRLADLTDKTTDFIGDNARAVITSDRAALVPEREAE